MNPIPKIIFASPKETGAGILIYNERTKPVICGRVIQYKSTLEMQTILNSKPPIAYAVVSGYNIGILYAGILGKGNFMIGGPDMIQEAEKIMEEMADWYLKNKILEHLPRFNRYKN